MRWVQSTLNQILNLQLPVDGILNVQTRSAIRSFQEKNGLTATGIVGPDTQQALMAAGSGQTSATNATEPSASSGTSSGAGSTPTAEPNAASSSSEFEFEADESSFGDILNRISSGFGNALGWLTGTNLTPIEDRTTFTAKKYGDRRKEKRELKNVYALVLHHTAGVLKERPEDLDHTNAHFVITPKGRILHLHPMERVLYASNGFNPGSVAVEFVGNFRNEKGICWYEGPRFLPCSNKPTPEQIKAGRDLVIHLRRKINLTHVLAHRQSSGQRDGCPGPDIWYGVGQWAVDNLGLNDGGPGYYILDGDPRHCKRTPFPEAWKNAMKSPADPRNAKVIASIPSNCKGKPIPDSWRKWGRTTIQPELSAQPFQQPEIDLESPEHAEWLQRSLNHVLSLRLPEDGVLGPATRSALRSFQRQRELDASGVLNLRTEGSLIAAGATPHRHPEHGERFEFETREFEASPSQPLLRRGSNGAAVVDLQKRLATFGFSPGAADGIFGSLTEAAVKNFQRSRGLAADGIVGSQTWGALLATTGPQRPAPSGSTGQPQVTINPGVLISDNAVRVLKDILRAAGLTRATITSGRRTSNDQSRIMYDLIERHGVAYAKNLYGSTGDKVIDAYIAAKAAGKSATSIKFAMESRIKQLGCHNVSHHCSDDYDVFDVAPSSITDDAAFRRALDAAISNGLIDMYIPPPDDPAFHIEIALKQSEREVMSEIKLIAATRALLPY